MTPTGEMVDAAIVSYQKEHPDHAELTLDQVIERLDPRAVAALKAGEIANILWAEHVSNIMKQFGRDGRMTVRLVRDDRGYETPVVVLPRSGY